MNRIVFKMGTPAKEPGTWSPWKGRVLLSCPKCGESGPLDHTVDKFGNVNPSIVCPNVAAKKCDFHEYGLLRDWDLSGQAGSMGSTELK